MGAGIANEVAVRNGELTPCGMLQDREPSFERLVVGEYNALDKSIQLKYALSVERSRASMLEQVGLVIHDGGGHECVPVAVNEAVNAQNTRNATDLDRLLMGSIAEARVKGV